MKYRHHSFKQYMFYLIASFTGVVVRVLYPYIGEMKQVLTMTEPNTTITEEIIMSEDDSSEYPGYIWGYETRIAKK